MRGDGDGWTTCARGHRHWGLHGAAGLLLVHRDPSGEASLLLQHRAVWSHHGGTWGVPGGARDAHESAREAALREAAEEVTVDLEAVRVVDEVEDDHGGWSYVTVVAAAPALLPTAPGNAETVALAWVAQGAVDADPPHLPLHPGFAQSWPRLRARLPETDGR